MIKEWHLIKNYRTNGFYPILVVNGLATVLSFDVLTKEQAIALCLEAINNGP